MKKNLLLMLILSMFSIKCMAGCDSRFCSGIQDEVIKSVYPTQGGKVYLEAPADKANLNCTLVEGYYMVLDPSHPLFKEIYSTVLTAMTAGKQFQVRIVENSSDCRVAYVRMWT